MSAYEAAVAEVFATMATAREQAEPIRRYLFGPVLTRDDLTDAPDTCSESMRLLHPVPLQPAPPGRLPRLWATPAT